MGRTFRYGGTPGFVVDYESTSRLPGRQIDFSLVPDTFRTTEVLITVGTGGAAQAATSVPVTALPADVPADTLLDFGNDKFAEVTVPALKGATSLTVEALGTALVAGETANFAAPDAGYGFTGKKLIPAGTIMAELASGLIVPRAVSPNGETASGILIDTAQEYAMHDALTGYGVFIGGVFYKELLPEHNNSGFAGAITELLATTPGMRFVTYSDSRVSEGLPLLGR